MGDAKRGIESGTADVHLNIRQFLEHAARAHGDQTVVTDMADGRHRYTYAEMYDRVIQGAHALRDLGVETGDAVAIYGYSTYRNVELLYATAAIGATLLIVNVELPPDHQEFCLDHAASNAPFDYAFVDGDMLADIDANAPASAGLEYVVTRETEAVGAVNADPVGRYEDLLAEQPTSIDWPKIHQDTAAIMGFTSGTTGRPKAITHSHRALWLHNQGYVGAAQLTPQETLLMVPPLFHWGWNMWGFAPVAGSKLVMPGPGYPDNLMDLLFEEDVTYSAGVATLFRRVAEHAKERRAEDPDFSLSGLRVQFAGQTPPSDLLADLEELGADTSQAYGYSESGGGPHYVINKQGAFRDSELAMDDEERFEYVAKVAGYPVMGVDLKVLDVETGEELPWDGESPGETAMRAPWCVNSYWGMPDRTAENREGEFLRMGDFVSIDEQANVTVKDRVKDAIKSGGEWIPSPTVEGLINRHEQIAESCVIAADHTEWGERPIVVVELAESVDPDDLDLDLESFLQPYVDSGEIQEWWIPDEVIVDDIPLTATGKFNKKVLRDHYGDVLL